MIYSQLLFGRYRGRAFSEDSDSVFVEYGFARHKPAMNEPTIDEPLAILAALNGIAKEFPMFDVLRGDIYKHAPRRNGFEAYLAFYFREQFAEAPALSSIFTPRDDFAHIRWMHDDFELVTVSGLNGSQPPDVSIVTPSSGPSSNLGFAPELDREVLRWITDNEGKHTFCFPTEALGPDIMFFVRSKSSRELLLVMVQAKCHQKVDKATLIGGIRSVTPSWFWKRRAKGVRSFLRVVCIYSD